MNYKPNQLTLLAVVVFSAILLISFMANGYRLRPTMTKSDFQATKPIWVIATPPQKSSWFARVEDKNEAQVPDQLDFQAFQINCFDDGRIQIHIEYYDLIDLDDHEQYFDLYIDVGERTSADAVITGSLNRYQYQLFHPNVFQNLTIDSSWHRPVIFENQLAFEFFWLEQVGSYEVARIWLVGGREPRRTYGLDMLGDFNSSVHYFYPQDCWLAVPKDVSTDESAD